MNKRTTLIASSAVALLGGIALWYHSTQTTFSKSLSKKSSSKSSSKSGLHQSPASIRRRQERILSKKIPKKKQDAASLSTPPNELENINTNGMERMKGQSDTQEEEEAREEEVRQASEVLERLEQDTYFNKNLKLYQYEYGGSTYREEDEEYAKVDYHGYSSFKPQFNADKQFWNQADREVALEVRRLSDWNKRFRACIRKLRHLEPTAQLTDRIDANQQLMHLAQDFIYAATAYGKIIISEYYLPFKLKTIKPCALGGLMGGQKYSVHNILFKFAVDNRGLFGSDYAAAKVAGNELRGLISYFNCHVDDVNVPLMALVDYRGFRLIAMSILPVRADTIVYGSCDAGRNIHATNSRLNELMAKAAETQNLKAHYCRVAKSHSHYSNRAENESSRVIFQQPIMPTTSVQASNNIVTLESEDDEEVFHDNRRDTGNYSAAMSEPRTEMLRKSPIQERQLQHKIEVTTLGPTSTMNTTQPLPLPSRTHSLPSSRTAPPSDGTLSNSAPQNTQSKVPPAVDLSPSGYDRVLVSSGSPAPATHLSSSDHSNYTSILVKSSPSEQRKIFANQNNSSKSSQQPRDGQPVSGAHTNWSAYDNTGSAHVYGVSLDEVSGMEPNSSNVPGSFYGYVNSLPAQRNLSQQGASNNNQRRITRTKSLPVVNSPEKNDKSSFISLSLTSSGRKRSQKSLESESPSAEGQSNDRADCTDSENSSMSTNSSTSSQPMNMTPGSVGGYDQGIDVDTETDSTELLYSPADLEGHIGADGLFYLLDFSRVLPPETPNQKFKNAHLSRLFRPEFVRDYSKPLCSDAFSGFIKGTPRESEHNKEIEEASQYLASILIPKVAKDLTRIMQEARDQGNLTKFRLTETVHSYGINCRHLGNLRVHITDAEFRQFILSEIVARCIKNNLRWKLREKMKQIALPLEEPYRRLVIDYLNVVFGNYKVSDEYWDKWLKQDLLMNFEGSLTQEEQNASYHLKIRKANGEVNETFLYAVFTRMTKMMGMKFGFGPSRTGSFLNPQPFDDTDLEQLSERVKHMNIIAHARGYFYHVKGLANRVEDPESAQKFYEIAIEKYEEALNSDPNNKEILLSMALTWILMIEEGYKHVPNAKFRPEDPKVQKAEEYSLRAIVAEPKYDSFSLFRYGQFLEKCGKLSGAEDYYLMALEADPNNAGCLHCYGSLLSERGYHEEAEEFFKRASLNTVGLKQWPQWYH